ncbi:hypothetical protein [Burkholderia stabilis]|uniref:Uncharacterized protein n=1 Tax=Burkholderia stabilis TaxID=95485 RepID=A0A1Y1BVK9_9BURK|nr:hypothetical protein [Burkholderia stabilis]BAX63805.1 hypothetical protein BSFP_066780 [Burkholderia stabilis]
MRLLTTAEADAYLQTIGMHVGSWNQIADPPHESTGRTYLPYSAPTNSRELYVFAHHAAGWLPAGKWKIFQIDNSSAFCRNELQFIDTLLGTNKGLSGESDAWSRSILFEGAANANLDVSTELTIARLIYLFLLFEQHAYVVSSASLNGQRLGVQDGVVYFESDVFYRPIADQLMRVFESAPLRLPSWMDRFLDVA